MRGPSTDLKRQILDRLDGQTAAVWTPVDFLDLGARAAVDKALQRLAAEGDIRRLGRGLYDRPKLNSLTNKPSDPHTRAIIDAVVRRDQARVVVDGMTAANDLGLTTAVPAQVTVLTDARLRPLQFGAQQIRFRQAAPSRLYWAGRPGMRVVQALYWLHDVLPTDQPVIIKRLRNLLAHDGHGMQIATDLRAGLSVMPIWMQSIVRELLSDQPSGGTDDGHNDPDHDDHHDHDDIHHADDDHPHVSAD